MQRRLAAVMVADVVGYGRLSQVDEEGTRARFQADLKEIFEPKIAAHQRPTDQDHGRRAARRVFQRRRCTPLRCRIAAGESEARRCRSRRTASRFPHRGKPRRRHRRGWGYPRRRREHRRPNASASGAGRHSHLRHRLRSGQGKASLRLRFARRTEGEEHRRAGPRLPAAHGPGTCRQDASRKARPAGLGAAGNGSGDSGPGRCCGCLLASRGKRRGQAARRHGRCEAVARRASFRQSEQRRRAGLSCRRYH